MINKALKAPQNDFTLDVWGNGEQGRAFVHVNDVIDALISAIHVGHNCGPIQISPNVCTKINEILKLVMSMCNFDITINYQTDKPEMVGRCANYAKSKKFSVASGNVIRRGFR